MKKKTSKRIGWLSLLLVGVAIASVGCANRDLKILCEEATASEQNQSLSPEMRAVTLAENLDRRLSLTGDVRKAFGALAMADPSQRYELWLAVAKDLGYPNWRCPALRRLTQPTLGVDGEKTIR